MVEAVTGLDRSELLAHEGSVPIAWLQQVEDLAARRAAGEPLQYLIGVAGFRHLELQVGPGVFIPRPETEALVELAMARLPDAGTLVDLCTGSGAVALAVAQERPDAQVFATEVATEALEWATKNRDDLELPVTFFHGDLFAPLPQELAGVLDVVTANPPYVADRESGALPADVIDHEPHVALFSGVEGMGVIDRIVAAAPRWLRPGGWLLLEIGEHQRTLVLGLLTKGGWMDATVNDDLAGRPRITEARWGPR